MRVRAPATSFLFVGFGFRSWWLRLFLKVLDITGNESRSLSLAIEDADADAESKGFFESDIFIQSGDWGALAKELVAGYQQVTSQDAARAKLPQSTTSSENRNSCR